MLTIKSTPKIIEEDERATLNELLVERFIDRSDAAASTCHHAHALVINRGIYFLPVRFPRLRLISFCDISRYHIAEVTACFHRRRNGRSDRAGTILWCGEIEVLKQPYKRRYGLFDIHLWRRRTTCDQQACLFVVSWRYYSQVVIRGLNCNWTVKQPRNLREELCCFLAIKQRLCEVLRNCRNRL